LCSVGLAGATSGEHIDTYHGRFVKLVPDEEVVEVVEFETADPAMQGEMTITISLADAEGGTEDPRRARPAAARPVAS
jgi:uncharacterized protein YndB with AHSA1/START domain